jgi:hypothetical protein
VVTKRGSVPGLPGRGRRRVDPAWRPLRLLSRSCGVTRKVTSSVGSSDDVNDQEFARRDDRDDLQLEPAIVGPRHTRLSVEVPHRRKIYRRTVVDDMQGVGLADPVLRADRANRTGSTYLLRTAQVGLATPRIRPTIDATTVPQPDHPRPARGFMARCAIGRPSPATSCSTRCCLLSSVTPSLVVASACTASRWGDRSALGG